MRKEQRHLKKEAEKGVFKEGQEVDAVVYKFTELGVNVTINDTYTALAYGDEIFEDVFIGQKVKAYIKCIREDGKIDVSLRPPEGKHVLQITERILSALKESGGKLAYNDKTSPEEIQLRFQVSKKVFKKAIGVLYKQRKIKITDIGIEYVT